MTMTILIICFIIFQGTQALDVSHDDMLLDASHDDIFKILDGFRQEISGLRAGYADLKAENDELRLKMEKTERNYEKLDMNRRQELDVLRNEISEMKFHQDDHYDQTVQLKKKIEAIDDHVQASTNLKNYPETSPVFFSAAASQLESYEVDDIIKFHDTISNVNPGFPGWNPATNMFTCPYDGYYLFIVSLFKFGDDYYNIEATLRKSDDTDIVELRNYEVGGSITNFGSSMQAIVPCEQGQQVWVAMTDSLKEDIRIYDCSTCHHSQFTGLLVKQGLE